MSSGTLKTEGDINLTANRNNWLELQIDAATKQVLQQDADVFLHQSLSTPCMNVVEECEGIWLKDMQGKRYMDFHGNNVHQFGYGNTFIVNRVKEQLDKLSFSPRRYTNQVAVDCATKLTSLTPDPLNKVLFAPSGTVAISTALKLARLATGKHKVISMWDAFHGATMDAISYGGEGLFRKDMGPLMTGCFHVPPATSYRGPLGDEGDDDTIYADYIEYVIEKEGDIGAVLVETIRNTDVQIPSQKYWRRVREICSLHNVLLILDEIPIAMGRTGQFFAFENFQIQPDILVLGKGLGGGVFPMAAIVAKDELDIAQTTALGHYTHEKSPVGAAAALASIEYLENTNLLSKVKRQETLMQQMMGELKDEFELIGDIRGIGLLWGIELVKNRQTKVKASEEAEQVMYKCLEQGLSFKVSQSNVLTLSPSLIIEDSDLINAVDSIRNALRTL
ncbi:MAG: aspartate aminotransferase family protein [Carboxylicivirga sp.]|jgi:4-aminobutyrate aminotransferase|nr:aspartate aminotransferase family protein [Carboxylicivirga sp.]